MIEKRGGEVGHTEMSGQFDGTTYTSRAWLRGASAAEIADNLVHEHLHRMGFTHERGYSRGRCSSIPYAIGDIGCEEAVAMRRFGLHSRRCGQRSTRSREPLTTGSLP